MPLYEFTCSACGEAFEELTSSHSVPPPCPKCGAGNVERRLSQVAPRLSIGLRGRAARESDARRSERESARKERFAEKRKKRREGG